MQEVISEMIKNHFSTNVHQKENVLKLTVSNLNTDNIRFLNFLSESLRVKSIDVKRSGTKLTLIFIIDEN